MDLRVRKYQPILILPRSETGLRALIERAPQAEAFAERVMQRLHPYLTWLYCERRRLATGAVGLFTAWLFLHVMFGANGMVVYRQKRTEYHDLRQEIDGLQQENGRYTDQIKALKTDPKTIEKEAREQLHYARPGEVVYVAPAPPQSQTPSTDAARK